MTTKTLSYKGMLEEDWQDWKERFLEGKVDGQFPEAEELREERRTAPRNLYVICHPDGAVYESDSLKGLFESMGKVDIYDLIEETP